MGIWDREVSENRSYFNLDTALIKKQKSQLTIRILGITILKRKIDFNADVIDGKQKLGFNN